MPFTRSAPLRTLQECSGPSPNAFIHPSAWRDCPKSPRGIHNSALGATETMCFSVHFGLRIPAKSTLRASLAPFSDSLGRDVDAGSTDATVQIAKQSRAVVLHSEPPVARERNLGGYSATGDLILFLDADTRLPETFVEDFVCEVSNAGVWTWPVRAISP